MQYRCTYSRSDLHTDTPSTDPDAHAIAASPHIHTRSAYCDTDSHRHGRAHCDGRTHSTAP
jgi:hypothetical protein